MPAIFVTPRAMEQQILDGADAEPRELRYAFRADAPERTHWRGKGRNLGFQLRHWPHDTNRAKPLQRESDPCSETELNCLGNSAAKYALELCPHSRRHKQPDEAGDKPQQQAYGDEPDDHSLKCVTVSNCGQR